MSLLLGSIALILTSLLVNAALPLRSRLANLIAIACLCFGQIVLLSEILSELVAMTLFGYLVGHLVLLVLALLLWTRRGRPSLWRNWYLSPAEIGRAIRAHPLLALFALAIISLSVVNFTLGVLIPSDASDELAYHLPRAFMWLQYQTARHYETFDFRQVEFPGNVSFAYLWLMLLSGGYQGLHIVQWLAGLVAAIATAGLARAAHHRPPAALFAGLIFLTGSSTIQQMATRHNDALVAATAAAFIYFAILSIQRSRQQQPAIAPLIYTGIAFGLALGTKLTVFLILPGAAIALLIYTVRFRGDLEGMPAETSIRSRLAPILALAASALLGFLLFGAYNYVLNTLDIGNPLSSHSIAESSAAAENRPFQPALYGPVPNLIRYTYQVMDWPIVVADENNPFFDLNLRVFDSLSQALHIEPVVLHEFSFLGYGMRHLNFSQAGYGPIIYAALLLSPFCLPLFLWRARRTRRFDLALLLLLIVWSWLILTAALLPWGPYRVRFFNVFMPLLVAALLPWLYAASRYRLLWLIPVMLLAVWTTAYVTFNGNERDTTLPKLLNGSDPNVQLARTEASEWAFLRSIVPPGSTLGISGHELRIFDVLTSGQGYRFSLTPWDQHEQRLTSGAVPAVLAPVGDCHQGQRPFVVLRLTVLFRCLLLPDPQAFLQQPQVIEHYGYQIDNAGEDPYLNLDPAGTLVHIDDYRLYIDVPFGLLDTPDLQVEVHYRQGNISADQLYDLLCNLQPIAVQLHDDGLSFTLGSQALDPLSVFQYCEIVFTYNPGLRVDSVQVFRHNPPPPDLTPDLSFAPGINLLAADYPASVSACQTLELQSWWRSRSPGHLSLRVYLVDDRGIALVDDAAPLDLSGAPGFQRRFLTVPCDALPADYALMLRLYDDQNQPLTISGADRQTLAPLGTVTVAAASG